MIRSKEYHNPREEFLNINLIIGITFSADGFVEERAEGLFVKVHRVAPLLALGLFSFSTDSFPEVWFLVFTNVSWK